MCLLIFFIRQLKKGPRNLPSGLEVWPGFLSSKETAALLGVELEALGCR